MYGVVCRIRDDAGLHEFWWALAHYVETITERRFRRDGDVFCFYYPSQKHFTHDSLKYEVFKYLRVVEEVQE